MDRTPRSETLRYVDEPVGRATPPGAEARHVTLARTQVLSDIVLRELEAGLHEDMMDVRDRLFSLRNSRG